MAEQWQIELEQKEREREQREEKIRAEERVREEAREKLATERENREREREERAEHRDQERENREALERQVSSRVPPPSIPSYSAGGGPSFLLAISESSFPLYNTSQTYEAPLLNEPGGYALGFSSTTSSLMGQRTVAPGSQWSIAGGYITVPIYVVINGPSLRNIIGLQGYGAVTSSVYRGAIPIFHGGNNTTTLAFTENTLDKSVGTVVGLPVGVEFNTPIVLGPGENISIEIVIEVKIAWAEIKEAVPLTGITIATYPFQTNINDFGGRRFPRNGSFRYNVEPIPQK